MPSGLLQPVRSSFRAIAGTIVPEAERLDALGWEEVEAIIEGALANRPPEVQRQMVAFVRLLQFAPLARYGRTFTALDAARRTRFLESVQNSPVPLLRRGFWGVRTLVMMGYYTRPMAAVELGYRASPSGWRARP